MHIFLLLYILCTTPIGVVACVVLMTYLIEAVFEWYTFTLLWFVTIGQGSYDLITTWSTVGGLLNGPWLTVFASHRLLWSAGQTHLCRPPRTWPLCWNKDKLLPRTDHQRQEKESGEGFWIFERDRSGLGRYGETEARQSAFLLRSCCAFLSRRKTTKGNSCLLNIFHLKFWLIKSLWNANLLAQLLYL